VHTSFLAIPESFRTILTATGRTLVVISFSYQQVQTEVIVNPQKEKDQEFLRMFESSYELKQPLLVSVKGIESKKGKPLWALEDLQPVSLLLQQEGRALHLSCSADLTDKPTLHFLKQLGQYTYQPALTVEIIHSAGLKLEYQITGQGRPADLTSLIEKFYPFRKYLTLSLK
jgi:hypothetical protein